MHTHTHTCMHTYTHAHTHTCMHTHAHTRTHTHTHMHTHTRMHAHTRTHTHTSYRIFSFQEVMNMLWCSGCCVDKSRHHNNTIYTFSRNRIIQGPRPLSIAFCQYVFYLYYVLNVLPSILYTSLMCECQ